MAGDRLRVLPVLFHLMWQGSSRTTGFVIWRAREILADVGYDGRVPSDRTFYRLFGTLSHGRNVTGSASTCRSLATLPVRPRPRHGETADSYVPRLAAANHLRFSYLRRYLATPRGSYGPIDAAGLATLAGRKPHAILRAFPELGPAALRRTA